MIKKIPDKFIDLLRETYLPNRVHNSNDMAVAVNRFKIFAEQNLRDRVEIHAYNLRSIAEKMVPRDWV